MIDVKLEPYELVALVDWHIEQKQQSARKEEFQEAEFHRRRALELMEVREAAGKAALPPNQNGKHS